MGVSASQPESSERAGLALEYGALRDEILKRVDVRHQITSLSLTLTGIFLGVALADGGANGAIALVYPVLAALLAMAWSQNEDRVRTAATYVRERLEPCLPGLGWETFMESARRARGDHSWQLSVLSHGGSFLCAQALAIGVGLLHFDGGPSDWLLLGADALAVAYVIVVMRRAGRR